MQDVVARLTTAFCVVWRCSGESGQDVLAAQYVLPVDD